MRTLEAKRKELNWKDLVKRSAKDADCSILINEPTLVTENGGVKIIYDVLDVDTKHIVEAFSRIKCVS